MTPMKRAYHALIDSLPAQLGVTLLKYALPEPHVTLTRQDVTVPGLPAGLTGLRLLHISDMHLDPSSQLADELPELAATVPHDFTVYTGDFIDTDDGIPLVAQALARMPRAGGSYAVLGNHDYRRLGRSALNDVARLQATLVDAGLQVLRNTSLPVCNGEIFIAGVDDPATHRDNANLALASVPDGACCLLLAHSPDILLRLGDHRPGLVLAGHTHGGQIRLPLFGPAITMTKLPRRLSMGLYDYDGVRTFVTRGIGYSGLNLRLGCPPEIALLTLRSPLAAERVA